MSTSSPLLVTELSPQEREEERIQEALLLPEKEERGAEAGVLRLGVIGAGYWGPNLVRNFSSLPDCEVVEVCDRDEGRLRHMQEVYRGVRAETEAARTIHNPEIEAVVVATPVRFHYELARESLLAGKHVFIEKPMASSSAECAELIRLAEERGLTLMVGHTFIYSSPVRKIKEIIDSGEIGEVLYISSRRLNLGLFQYDINVTWDLAPHDLSIILYLLGRMPTGVHCQGRTLKVDELEVLTNLSLHFPEQGFATVQSSWIDPSKVREMTIVGDRKMIVYNDNEPLEKIRIYDKRVEVPSHYDSFAEWQYSYHYGEMVVPYVPLVEPLKVECAHFLECIRTGSPPLTGGREGMQVVQILEAATKSLRNRGCLVELEL